MQFLCQPENSRVLTPKQGFFLAPKRNLTILWEKSKFFALPPICALEQKSQGKTRGNPYENFLADEIRILYVGFKDEGSVVSDPPLLLFSISYFTAFRQSTPEKRRGQKKTRNRIIFFCLLAHPFSRFCRFDSPAAVE